MVEQMKLVVITGAGAVGKMTVGQALTKITDLRLYHNHMDIEMVLEIFGKINGKVINKIREAIFEEFVESDCYGLIYTYMWAFDQQSDWDYINNLVNYFNKKNAKVYYVELVAPQEIRLQRNSTENRLRHKPSKRDIEASNNRIINNEDAKYRIVSNDGEITFENYIKIDNSNLEPDVVAKMIKDTFML
jgi:hypothetical protein